jgi:PQQ-dependent catabolism-associated CXXCW motif protein
MNPMIQHRSAALKLSLVLTAILLAGCEMPHEAAAGEQAASRAGLGEYARADFRPTREAPGALQRAPLDERPDAPAAGSLDDLVAWEREDFGVPPSHELHQGAMHGATPNRIPGAQVITTKGLLPLLGSGMPVFVFDVLGSDRRLPNAIAAVWAARPGSFNDETQQKLARLLHEVTRGDLDAPLVFYCGGPQCWMSYNAALRSTHLGYRNVLWYRGGVEAWSRATLSDGLQRAS